MNKGRATIKKDTNKLISAGFENWQGVRVGSFFKFSQDQNHYSVARVEPLNFIVDYEKIGPKTLKVASNTDININNLDTVTISYKEWEIQTTNSITNPGRGYRIGNVLTLKGGKPSSDTQSNLKNIASIEVTNVNELGEIAVIRLANKGKYYEIPSEISLTGGNGTGATLDISFKVCDNRTIVERDIENVEFDGSNTIFTINYALPEEVKFGKIGADKWEIYLATSYVEGTRINDVYEITRDFTPNLSLPILAKGSLSLDAVFNSAMLTLDNKIKSLESRLAILEGKP